MSDRNRNIFCKAFAGILPRLLWARRLSADLHPDSVRVLKKLSKKDIAVDCGANVGRFTEMMAQTGATVYAFEPNPDAFAVLSENIKGVGNATR